MLDLIAKGYTNPQIGDRLGITLDGAKWHVSEVLSKLGVNSREDAAAYWRAHNRPLAKLQRALAGLGGTAWLRWGGASGLAAVVGIVVVAIVFREGDGAQSAVEPTSYPNEAPPDEATSGDGPAIVYARITEPQTDRGGRYYMPSVDVVTRDATAPGSTSTFTIANVLAGPPGLMLRGETIVANHGERVTRYNIDGSDQQDLVSAPPGHVIVAVGLSDHGDRLAYWLASDDPAVPEMELIVHDLSAGTVIMRVASERMGAS